MSDSFRLTLALTSVLGFSHFATAATNGLDQEFGIGGVVLLGPTPVSALKIERVEGLAIQDDGKIVIGGRFYDAVDGAYLAAIGRLGADGSWDTSFGDHGLFVLHYAAASAPNGGQIDQVAVLSDHSVVASGGASDGSVGYESCTLLMKVDNAGALSATFAPDQSGSFCYDFAPNTGFYFSRHWDRIVVDASDASYLTSPTTNLDHGAVAHFDSNGALITSWGNNGVAHLPSGIFASLLQLTSNDIYAVGGTGSNSEIDVIRLDATGNIASTYGSNGVFSFDQQQSVTGQVGPIQAALDSQQRLLITDNDYDGAQTPSNMPYRFARVTDAGAFDNTFNGSGEQPGYPGFAFPAVSGGASEYAVAALPLPDGHLLATGSTAYSSPNALALLRLNEDASYDGAFGDAAHPGWAAINVLGTPTSGTYARSLAVDSSGHAFVSIDAGDGVIACPGLIRIVPDRLFDGHFDSPSAFPTCP